MPAVLGIIAVVAAALVLLLSGLDRIVAAAIEKYGSEATGTGVTVYSVRIRPAAGEGSIRNLSVENPRGFSLPDAIRLEDITISVDAGSVTGDPLVIDKVVVRSPLITYEVNEAGESNMDAIRKNLKKSRKTGAPKGKEKDEGGRKIVIRKLIIERGKVDVRVASLSDKPLSARLSRIELNNLGGKDGDSPSGIARQIAGPLLKEASLSASGAGIGRLFGKATEDVGGAFRKIFGK
ncbi:MAG: hypothetical protein IH611_04025 [Deltaproteobacteria bacterium]|nr:hypothetical protein [Deltaproteobacteria bacterium]